MTGCWQVPLRRCVGVPRDGGLCTHALDTQFPFPSVVQRVQQLTLEAAAQGVAEDAGGQEVAAPPEVKVEEVKAAEVVEVKQEERKEGAPPPIKRRLTLKRSVSKPASRD